MCGFVVFVGTGHDGGTDQVRAALPTIRHRGPDGSELVVPEPGVALGFQRLAVVDLTGSDQPLSYPPTDSRWTVCCNGEIYNYRQLREELIRDCGTPTVDPAGLALYLQMQYVPEPYTMDPQVRRLSAGHRL